MLVILLSIIKMPLLGIVKVKCWNLLKNIINIKKYCFIREWCAICCRKLFFHCRWFLGMISTFGCFFRICEDLQTVVNGKNCSEGHKGSRIFSKRSCRVWSCMHSRRYCSGAPQPHGQTGIFSHKGNILFQRSSGTVIFSLYSSHRFSFARTRGGGWGIDSCRLRQWRLTKLHRNVLM